MIGMDFEERGLRATVASGVVAVLANGLKNPAVDRRDRTKGVDALEQLERYGYFHYPFAIFVRIVPYPGRSFGKERFGG